MSETSSITGDTLRSGGSEHRKQVHERAAKIRPRPASQSEPGFGRCSAPPAPLDATRPNLWVPSRAAHPGRLGTVTPLRQVVPAAPISGQPRALRGRVRRNWADPPPRRQAPVYNRSHPPDRLPHHGPLARLVSRLGTPRPSEQHPPPWHRGGRFTYEAKRALWRRGAPSPRVPLQAGPRPPPRPRPGRAALTTVAHADATLVDVEARVARLGGRAGARRERRVGGYDLPAIRPPC